MLRRLLSRELRGASRTDLLGLSVYSIACVRRARMVSRFQPSLSPPTPLRITQPAHTLWPTPANRGRQYGYLPRSCPTRWLVLKPHLALGSLFEPSPHVLPREGHSTGTPGEATIDERAHNEGGRGEDSRGCSRPCPFSPRRLPFSISDDPPQIHRGVLLDSLQQRPSHALSHSQARTGLCRQVLPAERRTMRSEGVPCFHEFARREGVHRSLKVQSPINILHIQIVSDVRSSSPIPWP